MKKLLALCAVATLSGCSNIKYSVVRPDGSKEDFSASAFFANKRLDGLAVGKKTEKTSQGLGLKGSDDQVNVDAIKAAGDIVSQMTAAAVKGAVQGAK